MISFKFCRWPLLNGCVQQRKQLSKRFAIDLYIYI